MKRITMVVGAGAPLGFNLPKGVTRPDTQTITKVVRKPYIDYDGHEIKIVDSIYRRLKLKYPLTPQDIRDWKRKGDPKPNINFEMLFHVMESYLTYNRTWSGSCHNADISPLFGVFSRSSVKYNADDLRYIMTPFIERIMDIVNGYDQHFQQNIDKESWYRDFFRSGGANLDVFNFNYDTTIETSVGDYEDGFEPIKGYSEAEQFNPQKLWKNSNNLSTINHIHGCIRYYYPEHSWHKDEKYFTMHDLFKYKDYVTVKKMMEGRSQSYPQAQDHSEYYGGAIITGLRKTDKLNCIPYDFYHGYLYNCLLRNNALVIIGYSFGDFYMNNIIDRMALMHGEKKKVVLIDYWDKKKIENNRFEHFLEYKIPPYMGSFLMRMSDTTNHTLLAKDLCYTDNEKPMYSHNGNLMVLAGGLKTASNYTDAIYDFLRK